MKENMGHKMEMKVCFIINPCACFRSAQLSAFLTKYSKLNHINHLLSAFGSIQIINSE